MTPTSGRSQPSRSMRMLTTALYGSPPRLALFSSAAWRRSSSVLFWVTSSVFTLK